MNDAELLSAYRVRGSESAFRELVDRYIGMVFGVACRRLGDRQLAEEVTQNVFSILARKAQSGFQAQPVLSNWLYQTTLYQASAAYRTESNRRRTMSAFRDYEQIRTETVQPEDSLRPLLDEALSLLSSGDRDVVFLRFFERQSYAQIGRVIGKSEEASRKQTVRALGKLSRSLRRRGVVMSASVLAAGLPAQLLESAPIGMAATVSQNALLSAPTLTTTTVITNTLTTMAYAKTKIVLTVTILAASLPVTYEWAQQKHASRMGEGSPPTGAVPLAASDVEVEAETADPFHRAGESVTDLMKRILALESSSHQREEIRFLVRNADAEEIEEALAVLLAEKPDEFKHREAFLEAWAESNPLEALAHARTAEQDPIRELYEGAAMKGWTRSDPGGAWDYLGELPSNDRRVNLLNGFFEFMADHNRTQGLKIALEKQGPLVQRHHIDQLFHGWARRDREAAMAALETLDQPVFRDRALRHIVRDMAQQDVSLALDYVNGLEDEGTRQRLIPRLAQVWKNEDPDGLASFLKELPDATMREDLADQLLRGSPSMGELENRIQLLDALEDPALSEKHLPDCIEVWAWEDIDAASDYVTSASPAFRQAMLPDLAKQYARLNPEDGLAWGANLTEMQERTTYLGELIAEWAQKDLPAAVGAIEELDDPGVVAQALPDLASEYAKDHPGEAADWILEFEGHQATDATRQVMRLWGATDPDEAEGWLETHGHEIDRDAAVVGLSRGLINRFPQRAANLVLTMSDVEARDDRLEAIVSQWVSKDSRTLGRWLEEQDASLREKLLASDPNLTIYLNANEVTDS